MQWRVVRVKKGVLTLASGCQSVSDFPYWAKGRFGTREFPVFGQTLMRESLQFDRTVAENYFVELAGGRFFGEKGDGAGIGHCELDLEIVMNGNSDNCDGFMLAKHQASRIDAIQRWQIDVHHHHIRLQLTYQGDGLLPVSRFSHYREIGVAVQNAAKSLANHGMVVDQQNPHGSGGRATHDSSIPGC